MTSGDVEGVGGLPPDFLGRHGEDAGEIAWWAALAWLERAAEQARSGQFGRWRNYPRGELRRLRHDVAGAMKLARFAVAVQEQRNERERDLTRELDEQASRAAAAQRREGTREAERLRLLRAKARREGRELTDEERFPWL